MSNLDEQQMKDKITTERDYLLQKLWDAKVIISILLLAVMVKLGYRDNVGAPTAVVSTYEVSRNTDDIIGKTVTIRSKAIKKVGLSSFTVSDERFFGGEPIVVVNASGVLRE